jgi:long-subunit acyl-CoA synthetase (AMP-forming)
MCLSIRQSRVLFLFLQQQGSLGQTLKEVRPNHFFAVPRVWEKMQEAITAAGKGSGFVKRQVIGWAKEAALRGTHALMAGLDFQ